MHPYKIAGIVLGAFALLSAGFMIVGLALPGGWEAEREIQIAAPPEMVFPLLNSAARWEDWTPSPQSGAEFFGPSEGVGSGRSWDDPGYGQGEFVISASEPPREIRYEVQVEDGAIQIHGWIEVEAVAQGTRVHWREEGDFGWNPVLGYLAGRMSELQGGQLDASLGSLKELAETSVRSPRD